MGKVKKLKITEPYVFFICGPPGSGKETHAILLEKFLLKNSKNINVMRHENGVKLRAIEKNNSYTKHVKTVIKDVLDKGNSVVSALSITMWMQSILTKNTGNKHFIFDGINRKPDEVKPFKEAVDFFMPNAKRYVICLELSDDKIKDRLLNRENKRSHRTDDNAETLNNRILVYRKNTKPIIETFKKDSKYKILHIDTNQEIYDVHEEILLKIFWD